MKRKKNWLIAATVLAVCLAAALWLLGSWSNGPAEGTVHTGKTTASTQASKAASPLVVQTSLFTTELPAGFVQKDASAPTSELPVRVLATSQGARQQAGFSGGPLPADGLPGVADYHLRTTDTATYRPSTNAQLPAGSSTFESADGGMVTLFWPHGSRFVEVTVSGDPGTKQAQYTLLYKILQTWNWVSE